MSKEYKEVVSPRTAAGKWSPKPILVYEEELGEVVKKCTLPYSWSGRPVFIFIDIIPMYLKQLEKLTGFPRATESAWYVIIESDDITSGIEDRISLANFAIWKIKGFSKWEREDHLEIVEESLRPFSWVADIASRRALKATGKPEDWDSPKMTKEEREDFIRRMNER